MTPQSSEHVEHWLADTAGERWTQSRDHRAQVMAGPTELMLNLAGIGRGASVLEVAAGTGEASIEAAYRVGASGYVLATDISASMLAQAEVAAKEAGLSHLHTLVVDAQELALEPESFDAAICRYGLMFFPDRHKALRAIHRALKPGGKFAAVVWSTAEKNPFMSIPLGAFRRHSVQERPSTGIALSMGAQGVLQATLTEVGFRDVYVEAVAAKRRFSSVGQAIEHSKALPMGQTVSGLPEADAEAVWREVEAQFRDFENSDGLEMPSESLVGVGTK